MCRQFLYLQARDYRNTAASQNDLLIKETIIVKIRILRFSAKTGGGVRYFIVSIVLWNGDDGWRTRQRRLLGRGGLDIN
jgi:hypothetical protein